MQNVPACLRAICAAAIVACPAAFADPTAMDAEIDFLLTSVAESHCIYIRNGKEHSGEAARDHLQMKRERGKKYYDTTEEFIERIASKSSWSGKPYRIRCDDTEEDASAWFTRALESFRNQNKSN
jgi:low affinity Fe/Cu permease